MVLEILLYQVYFGKKEQHNVSVFLMAIYSFILSFREVSVALQSVFQPSELEQYVKMSKREKEEHLMELMCIVAGIRLFNRDCQRGGEGIDDCGSLSTLWMNTIEKKRIANEGCLLVPAILQEAVKKTHDSIMEFLEHLMSKIYKFTAAVEKSILMKAIIPFGIFTKKNVKWAKEMLTACRQQEIYVRLFRLKLC